MTRSEDPEKAFPPPGLKPSSIHGLKPTSVIVINPEVRGRSRGLYVEVTALKGGVVVRVDDSQNDEFWAEVQLTDADLARLGYKRAEA